MNISIMGAKVDLDAQNQEKISSILERKNLVKFLPI